MTASFARFAVAPRSAAVRRFVFAALLGATMACGNTGPEPATPRHPSEHGADVESKNLPPDEELDALLKGVSGVGRSDGAARVAVPTFKVGGRSQDAWMGTAVAEIVESRLSHIDGVSVLDRSELTLLIDELKRGADEVGAAEKHGKLLGAKHVILGSLYPAGSEKLHLVIRPVSVEDGHIAPSVELDIGGDD